MCVFTYVFLCIYMWILKNVYKRRATSLKVSCLPSPSPPLAHVVCLLYVVCFSLLYVVCFGLFRIAVNLTILKYKECFVPLCTVLNRLRGVISHKEYSVFSLSGMCGCCRSEDKEIVWWLRECVSRDFWRERGWFCCEISGLVRNLAIFRTIPIFFLYF